MNFNLQSIKIKKIMNKYTAKKQGVEYYPKSHSEVSDLVGCSIQTVDYHFSTKKRKEFTFGGYRITKNK